MQYTDKVMNAFQNPKNVGEIENADGKGMIGSEACGDIMEVSIKVENGVITDAKFRTFGCAAAIATSSTATEMIKGMTVDDGQGKVVFLTEKNASPAVLSSALSAAAQKRTESNVCLVLKKIKNFGFQLSSLKQAGYTEFFVCSEQGIKKLD